MARGRHFDDDCSNNLIDRLATKFDLKTFNKMGKFNSNLVQNDSTLLMHVPVVLWFFWLYTTRWSYTRHLHVDSTEDETEDGSFAYAGQCQGAEEAPRPK